MDFKEIKRIVELMDQHGLSVFKLEQEETKLELKKGGDFDSKAIQGLLAAAQSSGFQGNYAPVAQVVSAGAPVTPAPEAGLPANVKEITSPMVGTFYAASAPDADPFVKIGSKIAADSTVCIIEAMKVMNEIKAEIAGEVVEILVENGTAVQYGEPLFRVKTS